MLCSDLIRYGKSRVFHNWPEYSKSLEKSVGECRVITNPNQVTWFELKKFCENFLDFYPGTNSEKSFFVSVDAANLARQTVHQRIKSTFHLVSCYLQLKKEILDEKNEKLFKSL